MGIRGLLSYIENDETNFTNYSLHHTKLVLDAENVATLLYSNSLLNANYGGEYLAYVESIKSFLERLRQCHIEPIFVFGGCHDRKGLKTKRLISRAQQSIKELQTFTWCLTSVKLDSSDHRCNIMPSLVRTVLLEVLRSHNVNYIACKEEADCAVAELAVYLNCPVASGDSDFFIYRSPDSRPYRFIPLKTIQNNYEQNVRRCSRCETQGIESCCTLPCKMFDVDGPGLGRLSPEMVRMFAVFCGNDNISDIKLPAQVTSRYFSDRLSYSHRRIRSTIEWLRTFPKDSHEPLETVLSLYSDSERSAVSKLIHQCMSDYVLHPDQASPVLCSVLSRQSAAHNLLSPNSSKSSVLTAEQLPKRELDRLSDLMRRTTLNGEDEEDVFYKWPKQLIDSFQKLFLLPSLMDPLYVHHGVVNKIVLEDLNTEKSVNIIIKSLRQLNLDLNLGLEQYLKCSKKLYGLENGYCKVYHRTSFDQMGGFSVPVTPLTFPSSQSASKSFSDFFKSHLNIGLEGEFKCSKDRGIAVTLTLWFRYSVYARQIATRFRDSPLGLAFLCCALATRLNVKFEQDISKIVDHYSKLTSQIKKSHPTILDSAATMKTLHQISELQSLSHALPSLVHFVDILTQFYVSPEKFDFKPNGLLEFDDRWILYASCGLLFWLSQSLDAMDAVRRYKQAIEHWLPKLLMYSNKNVKDCELPKFDYLIDYINDRVNL